MIGQPNSFDVDWSIPLSLSDASRSLVLRGASAVAVGASFASAGLGIHAFDLTSFSPRSFKVLTASGRVVDGPSGNWTFAYPIVNVTAQGDLTLLWGEPADRMTVRHSRDWPAEQIVSLWQATLTSTLEWSAPSLLVAAERITWNRDAVAATSTARGVVGPLAVVTKSRHGREITVLEHADRWHAHRAVAGGTSGLLFKSAATVGTPQAPAIVVSAQATDQLPQDVLAIEDAAIVDERAGWRIIYRAPPGRLISALQSFPMGGRAAMLVFVETDRRGTPMVRVLRRTNRSDRWESADSLVVGFPIKYMRAAIDHSGTMHLFTERSQIQNARIAMFYASFREQWTPIIEVFKGRDATDAALTTSSTGVPMILFTQTRGGKVLSLHSRLLRQ